MLLDNGNGTVTGGPLDILCILHSAPSGRYHVAFFEEHPLPSQSGESVDEIDFVRLKSILTHTDGADTLEGAHDHLREMREKLILQDENVTEVPLPWDGTIGTVWMVGNWRKTKEPLEEVLKTSVGRVVRFTTG